MAGSIIGGRKARDTNIKRHGADYYVKLGALGGAKGHYGGFNCICVCDAFIYEHVRARCAGTKGGRISRRTKKLA